MKDGCGRLIQESGEGAVEEEGEDGGAHGREDPSCRDGGNASITDRLPALGQADPDDCPVHARFALEASPAAARRRAAGTDTLGTDGDTRGTDDDEGGVVLHRFTHGEQNDRRGKGPANGSRGEDR